MANRNYRMWSKIDIQISDWSVFFDDYRWREPYIKKKYSNKAQLGYINTDSFIFQVKIEDIYKSIAEWSNFLILIILRLLGFSKINPRQYNHRIISYPCKLYHYILTNKSTKSKHKEVSKKGIN